MGGQHHPLRSTTVHHSVRGGRVLGHNQAERRGNVTALWQFRNCSTAAHTTAFAAQFDVEAARARPSVATMCCTRAFKVVASPLGPCSLVQELSILFEQVCALCTSHGFHHHKGWMGSG